MEPRPRAVLLDLYDTLIYAPLQELSAAVAAAVGADPDIVDAAYVATSYQRYAGEFGGEGADMSAIFDRADLTLSDEALEKAIAAEAQFARRSTQLYPDTISGLQAMRDLGFVTQIVSNASMMTRALVDHLELPALVDDVVLSSEVGATKPDGAIFELALDRIGCRPEDAWFVDDKIRYLDGATAAGLRGIQIRRDQTADFDGEWTAGPVVTNLRDALAMMLSADGERSPEA